MGFWQLGRAEEKALERAQWETLSHQEWPLIGEPSEGQPVTIEGQYIPERQWLLDNRTRGGRAGYEVLTLFQPDNSPAVVVNRGWIAGMHDRAELPAIPVESSHQQLQARVAEWPVPPVIGEVEGASGWPRRVQMLTPELASQSLDEAVSPVFLRLAGEQQPGALQADWKPSRMGANTHYGYAVQWFGLAIALLALGIVASFHKPQSIDLPHD